jgi:hypothetical protein
MLKFSRDPNSSSAAGDIGGAAWYKTNFNNNEGLSIRFKPEIDSDLNYYGNVKYPQGFALVFTGSQVSHLMGAKRSGLGYDGINDAIAFEFDFIQNMDKNDVRYPHFSIASNLQGAVGSLVEEDCKEICNIRLPNFYDSQKEGYNPGHDFIIDIYGGKIWVKYDGSYLISGAVFPAFDDLMEKNSVFFGFTASMNLNKAITISDIEVLKSNSLLTL